MYPSVVTTAFDTAAPSTYSLTFATELTGADPIILTVRPCSFAARVPIESDCDHTV